jgi:hypothetical protein
MRRDGWAVRMSNVSIGTFESSMPLPYSVSSVPSVVSVFQL